MYYTHVCVHVLYTCVFEWEEPESMSTIVSTSWFLKTILHWKEPILHGEIADFILEL